MLAQGTIITDFFLDNTKNKLSNFEIIIGDIPTEKSLHPNYIHSGYFLQRLSEMCCNLVIV